MLIVRTRKATGLCQPCLQMAITARLFQYPTSWGTLWGVQHNYIAREQRQFRFFLSWLHSFYFLSFKLFHSRMLDLQNSLILTFLCMCKADYSRFPHLFSCPLHWLLSPSEIVPHLLSWLKNTRLWSWEKRGSSFLPLACRRLFSSHVRLGLSCTRMSFSFPRFRCFRYHFIKSLSVHSVCILLPSFQPQDLGSGS